nr:DUF2802 domain-containing protein [Legionella hackeliae]
MRNSQKMTEGLKENIRGIRQELKQLQRSHMVLVNADLGFSKQIAEINRQLVSMDNQLQALENKRDNDGGYQHALRILEMGGDKEEIMNSCHLSNAEAELLMNLHAYRAVIKTHPHMNNS